MKYVPLLYDLLWFMRLLKQRFARWDNAFYKTFGALWAERFTSVIVEGEGEALLATCAYVDLNPVRAKLVSDPQDYRWSGYGEAVGGLAKARTGLARAAWEEGSGRLTGCQRMERFEEAKEAPGGEAISPLA